MNETIGTRFALLMASVGVSAACTPTPTNPPENATPSTDEEADKAEHQCGDHAEGACAGMAKDEAAKADPQLLVRSLTVATGDFAEVNFILEKGASISAQYAVANGQTEWNVHSHDDNHETIIHSEGTDASGVLEFVAPADGVYSFLWVNQGPTPIELDVDVSLSEGARIHSWVPAQE